MSQIERGIAHVGVAEANHGGRPRWNEARVTVLADNTIEVRLWYGKDGRYRSKDSGVMDTLTFLLEGDPYLMMAMSALLSEAGMTVAYRKTTQRRVAHRRTDGKIP